MNNESRGNLLLGRAEEEVELLVHLAAESLSEVALRTARLHHMTICRELEKGFVRQAFRECSDPISGPLHKLINQFARTTEKD